jgi:hypothetical protein
MTRRVLRYEVPIDDQWHDLVLPRPPFFDSPVPLHIASREKDVMEVWYEIAVGASQSSTVRLRVFGTGEHIKEPHAVWRGTCLTEERPAVRGPGFARGPIPRCREVWHLYEDVDVEGR